MSFVLDGYLCITKLLSQRYATVYNYPSITVIYDV